MCYYLSNAEVRNNLERTGMTKKVCDKKLLSIKTSVNSYLQTFTN